MSRELTAQDVAPAAGYVCNDGLFGCTQNKPFGAFYQQSKGGRVSPTLCDSCLNHMAATFGVPIGSIDLLVIARHQEYSLIRQAKSEPKSAAISEGLRMLAADKVARLSGYTKKLIEAFAGPNPDGATQRVERAYVRWWRKQLGIEAAPAAPTIAPGVFAGAIPVGDR